MRTSYPQTLTINGRTFRLVQQHQVVDQRDGITKPALYELENDPIQNRTWMPDLSYTAGSADSPSYMLPVYAGPIPPGESTQPVQVELPMDLPPAAVTDDPAATDQEIAQALSDLTNLLKRRGKLKIIISLDI